MLSWDEYLKELLNTTTVLDKMSLQRGDKAVEVSSIVRASIQMLESMIATEGRHNIFVFPEIKNTLVELVLSKIVYNVSVGKINISYDPHQFVKGQKLKYKNCVVEFVECLKEKDGIERVVITFKDGGTYHVPMSYAPVFQIAESNTKRFSTSSKFYSVFSAKQALAELNQPHSQKDVLESLFQYKTHLDGSVFLVSSVKTVKNDFDITTINGVPVSEALLIGKVTSEGKIEGCYPGQLSGNPAIVLASDLFSVRDAIEKGARVQSIIIDCSQTNVIENQLDILDELTRMSFPILVLADTSNSFNLEELTDRDYNVWRWDSASLTETVRNSSVEIAERKIRNCAKQKISYVTTVCDCISDSVDLLYRHKEEIDGQSTDLISTYNKLFSLLFTALRIAVPFDREDALRTQDILSDCRSSLTNEQRFIRRELFDDLSVVLDNFTTVFSTKFTNPKTVKIEEILASGKYSSICFVIAEKLDKSKCEEYWRSYTVRKHLPVVVKVMYPQEYYDSDYVKYEATIIVGWLNCRKMRNVIYSFGTSEIIVLTFPCEEKWRRAHTRKWDKSLKHSNNYQIVKNSLSKKSSSVIADTSFVQQSFVAPEISIDELGDIEHLIQTNTYRQYGCSPEHPDQIVDAVPVNFVGGYLAFYGTGHKVISVTDVIVDGKDSLSMKTPDQLQIGDFVAVRESDRDIIKDIADKILENSGKANFRNVAKRWKETLKVGMLFSTSDEIYSRLKSVGCGRGFQTIINWIDDEDQFSLSDKNDLLYIAQALNDDILLDTIDEVYNAGIDVKRAHIQAGRYLSGELRKQVVSRINDHGTIDAFNIWEPITLDLTDIGKVKILKIIDINPVIKVNIGNTNRLLSE